MPVIAITIEPYAVTDAFVRQLADRLDLELLDLREFERSVAESLSSPVLEIPGIGSAPCWHMTFADVAARLSELTLEAALRQRSLVVGSTCTATLFRLSHVATVKLRAPEHHRASALQRKLRFPHYESALLELESEDSLMRGLVNRLYGDGWQHLDRADLEIDTARVSEATSACMIEQLAGDSRCAVAAAAEAEAAILGLLRELR